MKKLRVKESTGAALGLVFIMGFCPGEVWGQRLKSTFSGTFTSTQIDTNGDSAPANSLNFKGKGSVLGRFNGSAINESQPSSPLIFCTLPDGAPGIQLESVQGSFVLRAEGTGDLLFTEVSLQENCLSLSTCVGGQPQAGCLFSINQEQIITGGTGRFAGASGSLRVDRVGGIFSS